MSDTPRATGIVAVPEDNPTREVSYVLEFERTLEGLALWDVIKKIRAALGTKTVIQLQDELTYLIIAPDGNDKKEGFKALRALQQIFQPTVRFAAVLAGTMGYTPDGKLCSLLTLEVVGDPGEREVITGRLRLLKSYPNITMARQKGKKYELTIPGDLKELHDPFLRFLETQLNIKAEITVKPPRMIGIYLR